MKNKVLLVAAIGMLASAPVFAGEGQKYVALDVGQSKASNTCNGIPAGVSCKDTATAYRIAGGYGFNKNFGVEVSYSDYGKAKASGTVLGVAVSADAGATAFQVVGTGELPLSEQFSLTAKLGVAAISEKVTATAAFGPFVAGMSATANNTNAVIGIGAEYAFTPAVSVRVNYEDLGTVGDAATTGTSKLTATTIGVAFKF